MKKSPEEVMKAKLFPGDNSPKLSDIKQDPALQDCWFLSSITALLTSQGTQSIQRLFTPSQNEGFVNIRLGYNNYEVPMGRICSADGKSKFGSNSAPWVVALENAMMIHLSLGRESDGIRNNTADMNLKEPLDGLKALVGSNHYDNAHFIRHSSSGINAFNAIKDSIDSGMPVVLGHAGNALSSLGDGIAPNHAITVLDCHKNEAHPDKSFVTVLDPYGEVKNLYVKDLSKCMIYTASDSFKQAAQQGETIQDTFDLGRGPDGTSKEVEITDTMQAELDKKNDDF